jgi:hypothetical protein
MSEFVPGCGWCATEDKDCPSVLMRYETSAAITNANKVCNGNYGLSGPPEIED